jgi:hypothetical protein
MFTGASDGLSCLAKIVVYAQVRAPTPCAGRAVVAFTSRQDIRNSFVLRPRVTLFCMVVVSPVRVESTATTTAANVRVH